MWLSTKEEKYSEKKHYADHGYFGNRRLAFLLFFNLTFYLCMSPSPHLCKHHCYITVYTQYMSQTKLCGSSDVAEKQTWMCKKRLLVPGPIWSKRPNRVARIEEEIKMCAGSISMIRELFVKNNNKKTRMGEELHSLALHVQFQIYPPTYCRTMSVECSSHFKNIIVVAEITTGCRHNSSMDMSCFNPILVTIFQHCQVSYWCKIQQEISIQKSKSTEIISLLSYLAETFHHIIRT